MNNHIKISRALISVSDKNELVPFAQKLTDWGIEILSTGGSGKHLREAGVPIVEVAHYTGMLEMMGGRVKTLHPKIHAALLCRRGVDDDEIAQHDILPIDLLVVNLYPFLSVIRQTHQFNEAIEQIDIGGVAMLRAAAKNHQAVAVVTEMSDYTLVLDEMQQLQGALSGDTRRQLASKAFAHAAQTDHAISSYLAQTSDHDTSLPHKIQIAACKVRDLPYGENPHQKAALYTTSGDDSCAIRQHQGKPMSYNNYIDANCALTLVTAFDQPTCVIVKHANPCAVASAPLLHTAYQQAYQADPISSFGGIIAFNRPIDVETAQALQKHFIEVLIAPAVDEQTSALLRAKPNRRVLIYDTTLLNPVPAIEYRTMRGGILAQSAQPIEAASDQWEAVTDRSPTPDEWRDLIFGWRVVQMVKSNAIVYAKNETTLGIGAGQMSRIFSAKIAATKAQEGQTQLTKSVLASDAFFPYPDTVDFAASLQITAIIQPGGSKKDNDSIAAANKHGMAMVFTSTRHFRH